MGGHHERSPTGARALEHGGFDHDQALALSESLAEEIEQTAATKEYVELVVTREIHGLRAEMLREIGGLRTDMIGALADLKTSMIKWMVGLMVGQFGLILVVGNMLWGK